MYSITFWQKEIDFYWFVTGTVSDMDEKFYCNECDFDTTNKSYLNTHKRVKHTNEGICYTGTFSKDVFSQGAVNWVFVGLFH